MESAKLEKLGVSAGRGERDGGVKRLPIRTKTLISFDDLPHIQDDSTSQREDLEFSIGRGCHSPWSFGKCPFNSYI